ncbi:GNAT family N-acetyltransferase [Ornithobacterium rhinotracheale]|uniref:GNAT family N-acetyltransferase n=1 Tax=Ornithobacterium rhinotracheale TaxID=28251 RepID=UPI001FF246E4|nr:GNAT family N-acetyltransferase [Ornithobacterium rhinotracheale]MCK0202382.1 GNAT family N-acetyltransferase [Ornithobacterium rhinotracheale]
MQKLDIRKICLKKDIDDALNLTFKTFIKCNSEDCNAQGFAYISDFLKNKETVNKLDFYATFVKGKIVGMIAFGYNPLHISLFFVEENYQGLKIGNKLFNFAIQNIKEKYIWVKSSTLAVKFYEKLGFVIVDSPEIKNGLKSTLMKYEFLG